MIVKILAKSSDFGAVDYNERKVAQGSAQLIDLQNFSYLQEVGTLNSDALQQYLMEFSARNERIKYPQFHVTFSARGKEEYTHEELKEIARQWLDKMGYKNEGQPLLIYAHNDTGNNHIHVITSRVSPDGTKIAYSFERSRAQMVMDEILDVDNRANLSEAVQKATTYQYENINQFKAILETAGYESYEQEDKLMIKRNGAAMATLPLTEIERQCGKDYLTGQRKKQLKAIVKKYQSQSADKEELRNFLKKRFGLDLVFVGSKDKPYGYMIVDHKDKAVYKGSAIMPIRPLLSFTAQAHTMEAIKATIDDVLQADKHANTYDINKALERRFGKVWIEKGKVHADKQHECIDALLLSAIKYNDKCATLQRFQCTTEEERKVIAKLYKVRAEDIQLTEGKKGNAEAIVNTVRQAIMDESNRKILFASLREQGIRVARVGTDYYCVDHAMKRIIKAADYGIEFPKAERKQAAPIMLQTVVRGRTAQSYGSNSLLDVGGGSGNSNREWEVGGQGYDDFDDEKKLKR